MPVSGLKKHLEKLYTKYNRREFVHPDPLEFLYRYEDPADREIAGMIASALAYGNIRQILRSVAKVLDAMSPSPYRFLIGSPDDMIKRRYADFRHRFTSGSDKADFLISLKNAIKKYRSLKNCFLSGFHEDEPTVIPALTSFVAKLAPGEKNAYLLPTPARGSACKRLNLFLRWMVRSDSVDPGGWSEIPRSKLVIPLDTHMHRIALELGLTKRRQADLRTAIDITAAFSRISPADPVKYDFCLTRPGIWKTFIGATPAANVPPADYTIHQIPKQPS